MANHLLSLMLVIPFAGALLQGALPAGQRYSLLSRWIAFGSSLISAVLGIVLIASMDPSNGGLQLIESVDWIQSYAITYELGLDGLSALILLLLAVVFPVIIAAEWRAENGQRGLYALLLLLQSSVMGAVCAQDLFVMFFFWGMSSLPLYFLLAIWGSESGREQAAFRFTVSATLGNILLFSAFVLVYYSTEPNTFLIRELASGTLEGRSFRFLGQTFAVAPVCVSLFALGLALRAPLWPLHGWFTRVAQEAPLPIFGAVSVVSIPVGTYLFLRLSYTLFPVTSANASDLMMTLGMINLVLGVACAVAQRNLRLLLAYLGLAETGLILVGFSSMASAGWVGSIYQQFSAGLSLVGIALLAGVIQDRTGTVQMTDEDSRPVLGGIAGQAPATAVAGGFFIAALLGIPGMGGFVSQALLILGGYPVYPVAMIVAGVALLAAAYQMFRGFRWVFLGTADGASAKFADLSFRERAYLAPVAAVIVIAGVYPKPLIELVRSTAGVLLGAATR